MNNTEQALWDALDTFVMVRDEELGYDVPQEQLKTAVREFVDQYFRDSAYAAEQAREDEELSTDDWDEESGRFAHMRDEDWD